MAPEEISIGDVIRVTESTNIAAECVGGQAPSCGIKRAAPINRMLGEALEAFITVLDQHTLAELIGARRLEAATSAKPTPRKAARLAGATS